MNFASTSYATAKTRGLVLGSALGDALGSPFEGEDTIDGALLVIRERSAEPLQYTDDTAQTLVLMRHLVRRRDRKPVVDATELALDLARAFEAEPWRGYGSGSREVLERVLAGIPWTDAAKSAFSGQGSYGNGAAMRVAPVALIATSLQHCAELARRTAEVTHAHPQGQDGAVLQACAVFLALHSEPTKPLDRDHFLDQLSRTIRRTEWQARLDRIRYLTQSASPSYAALRIGNGVAAIESVPMALHAFLQYPDHAAEAIRYAIRAGGDTDTIAAMTGALVGARNGIQGLPTTWMDRLENADRMRELADKLAPRAPLLH